ncbi:MAG: PAS domain S-box protein [Dehalococcoidales bacterium]
MEAKNIYHTLVEKCNDGIIIIQDGEIKFANRQLAEMTGFTIEESIGKNIFDFISSQYRDFVFERYSRRIKGEDVPHRYEVEINRKDGSCLPVEMNAGLIDFKGQPAVMGIIRDISVQKEAERKLAENEERYRSLFENSYDAILLTITDGRILAANPAACRMFGRSEQEICQLGRKAVIDSSDPRLPEALEKRRLAGEFSGELTFVRADNSKFEGEVSSKVHYDSKGNSITTMIVRDVTGRKKEEQQALRQKAVLEAINRVFEDTLECETDEEVARISLSVAEQLTGSQFGWIGEINKAGLLDTLAQSDPGWQACRIPGTTAAKCIRDMEVRGIWGRVLKSRKALITNEPSNHPDSVGVPEGHPSLTSFLGVPLKDGRKTLGIIALANKPGGYTSLEREAVEKLSVAVVEVLRRKRADNRVRLHERHLQELLKLHKMRDEANKSVSDYIYYTLESVQKSLQSQIAFIGMLNEDESVMTIRAWTEVTMKQCAVDKIPIQFPIAQSGLWGEAIRQRSPIVINDYGADIANKKGYPKGHIPIKRFMSVPIFSDNRIVAVGAVANKASEYDDSDVSSLTSLLHEMWNLAERKRAEDALKESEQKYRSLVENTPVGVAIMRGEKILFANSQNEQISGYTIEELESINPFDVIYEEDRARVAEYAAMRMRGEPVPSSYDVRIIHKDGTLRWLRRSVVKIDWMGEKASLIIDSDISERIKAEQAVKSEKDYVKSILDTAPAIIVTFNTEGQVIDFNNYMEKLSGYSIDAVKGKDWLTTFIPQRVREHVRETMAVAFTGIEINAFVNPILLKNGQERLVEWYSTVLKDKDDNITSLLAIGEDVTERIRAEENLRFSDMAFKSIKEGIVVTTMDNVITGWNEGIEKICGIEASEAIGKKLWEIVHIIDVSQADFSNSIDSLMNTGYGRSENLVEVNGKKIWLEVSAQVVKGRNNNNDSVLSIVTDITERKKIEQKLADEATRRRILIEKSRDGIVILDRNGAVYEANQRFAEMVGYSEEELKNLHVWDWEAVASREELYDMINSIDEKGAHVETKHRRKDGSVYDVEMSNNAAVFAGQKLIFCVCRDITERKKIEQELIDEATRRRMLIEKSRDGIVIMDQRGAVYEANQRFAEMLGYSKEEVKKLYVWDWDAVQPREQLIEMFIALDEEDAPSEIEGRQQGLYFETKHRRKDGTVFDVEISSNAAIFAGQKLIFSVSRDITERKKAEEALKESERKHRILFETMLQGVVYQNNKGEIISANPAAERILGLTLEQMQGKTSSDPSWHAIHENGTPFFGQTHPAMIALKTGKQVRDTVMGVYNTQEGNYRWIIINAMPQFKENENKPYQVYTTFNDITQIKQIEKELIQSQKMLREALDSWETTFNAINNAICLLTLDDTVIRCNKAMGELVGKPYEDVEGEKLMALIGPGKHKEGCPHLKMKESKRRQSGEMAIGEKWYYVVIDPIFDDEGELIGSVHTMEDITERKNMEERMIMTERLASIGELSSGIAHEINNPLTSVIGISELLLGRDDIPDDILKDLQMVNSEAQRAAKVVKNLLVFARKHPNEMQLSDVNQAVEKVLELREYEQKVNNIRVIRELDLDLPRIWMDYFQIQQVFLNIVVNAEFAMKEAHNEGTIIIKSERAGEMVRVSFTDDGPGISRENLKQLFDPFFTTKEVGKGTGLGLSICHGIILQHRGNIYAESELGKGATFIVELPINPLEETDEENNE